MPRPTSGTTLQRPDLAGLAQEYVDDQNLYIGLNLYPVFEVADQAADYPTQPDEWVANTPDAKRGPRGDYNRTEWKFGTDTYSCTEHGLEHPVDDVEVKLYKRYFDAEKIATELVTGDLLRLHERRVLDACQALSVAATPTNEWDDTTNAVPYEDIRTARETIEGNTGVEPNTLVIAFSTFLDLGKNAEIVDRIKYTYPGIRKGQIGRELLAEYLNMEQVLVSKAARNSAKEGQAASFTKLWSNEYALVCNVVMEQVLKVPQLGRTFLWTEDSPTMLTVESYYEDQIRGNIIRVRHQTDEETIWTAAAYLLDNITT